MLILANVAKLIPDRLQSLIEEQTLALKLFQSLEGVNNLFIEDGCISRSPAGAITV